MFVTVFFVTELCLRKRVLEHLTRKEVEPRRACHVDYEEGFSIKGHVAL